MPAQTVLDDFFDGIGSIASEPKPEAPAETQEVYIEPEEIEAGILEHIGGSGEASAERDLLFIAAYAMENADIRTPGDFAVWLARELSIAKRSAGPQPNPQYVPPKPDVQFLAEHLRRVAPSVDFNRSFG